MPTTPEDYPYDFYPLPRFGDGSALSAGDLNLLTLAQMYIAESNMSVYANWQMEEGDELEIDEAMVDLPKAKFAIEVSVQNYDASVFQYQNLA